MSLKEAIPELRRPFTPAAVKFKPQSVLGEGKGVLCVAYIDARLAGERLNHIVPDDWSSTFRPVGDGLMWCDLTVCGTTRSDVGEGKGKALVSDALKRAAVHFGVGVSLYAIPQQRIWVNQGRDLVSVWKSGTKPNGKDKYDAKIEDAGHAHLVAQYGRWLEQAGVQAFGEPLDHGDTPDSAGEPEPTSTVTAEALSEAAAAKDAGVKLGPLLTEIGADVTGGVTPAVRSMSPEQVERFRVVVAEAKSKLGATEVTS